MTSLMNFIYSELVDSWYSIFQDSEHRDSFDSNNPFSPGVQIVLSSCHCRFSSPFAAAVIHSGPLSALILHFRLGSVQRCLLRCAMSPWSRSLCRRRSSSYAPSKRSSSSTRYLLVFGSLDCCLPWQSVFHSIPCYRGG